MAEQAAPVIPFPIASRKQSRSSFTLPTVSLSASLSPQTPIEIPATGYLRYVDVRFTVATSGGTPQVTADAPFSLVTSIGLRTSDGTPILVPVTGYQLYLINKYGGQGGNSPVADPKYGYGYVGTATAYNFWLRVPFEFDAATGLGSVPALASNRNFQLDMTLTSIAGLYGATTPPTTVTVNVSGTAHYWAVPVAANDAGLDQSGSPIGLGTLARWQLETPPVTPGDKFVKSNNVGGTLGALIFVLRTSAAARSDSDWPALSQIYLDNEPQSYWTKGDWERKMVRDFMLASATKDTANGLDSGVYVWNLGAEGGSIAGDPQGTRAQYLSTLDASLLQLWGSSFGATSSTLEILTLTISAANAAFIYAK